MPCRAATLILLVACAGKDRPRVLFYSAEAWTNDVPGLVEALEPLRDEGVTFLSASEAMGCAAE